MWVDMGWHGHGPATASGLSACPRDRTVVLAINASADHTLIDSPEPWLYQDTNGYKWNKQSSDVRLKWQKLRQVAKIIRVNSSNNSFHGRSSNDFRSTSHLPRAIESRGMAACCMVQVCTSASRINPEKIQCILHNYWSYLIILFVFLRMIVDDCWKAT